MFTKFNDACWIHAADDSWNMKQLKSCEPKCIQTNSIVTHTKNGVHTNCCQHYHISVVYQKLTDKNCRQRLLGNIEIKVDVLLKIDDYVSFF